MIRHSRLALFIESLKFLGLAAMASCKCIVMFPMSFRPRESVFTSTQIKSVLVVVYLAIWWSMHPFLSSPVLPHPLRSPYTHPHVPLRIHSSVQSITGLIVVGEALAPPGYMGEVDQEMHSVRYLRASHSILGGVWMGAKVGVLDDQPPILDSFGTQLGDSIYSAFVLQEAARLINNTKKGQAGSLQNALIM